VFDLENIRSRNLSPVAIGFLDRHLKKAQFDRKGVRWRNEWTDADLSFAFSPVGDLISRL
jgi:hypothetical protein